MHSASAKQATARFAAAEANRWIPLLARLGFASRGLLYVIVGGLALLAALGEGGETPGTRGAISKILRAPAGWLIVLAMSVGLLGYGVWRFCEAVFDADGRGNDKKSLAVRGFLFLNSLIHVGLAFWAAKLAFGYATGNTSEKSLIARLMSQPFGQWLVGAVGAAFVGFGISQVYKAYEDTFDDYFRWTNRARRRWQPICKFGLYSRGAVFIIIGCFVIYAAITTDPSSAGGLHDALEWLRSRPYGRWLLAIVALGLAAFGVHCFVQAAYRRMRATR